MTWFDSATCATVDPYLWHPDEGDNASAKKAKAICAECPVRAECLQHALATDSEGIAAALTRRERADMFRGAA